MSDAEREEDGHPPLSQPSSALHESRIDDLTKTTQAVLQNACKRRKLSTSGTKSVLSTRLIGAGFKSLSVVKKLSDDFILNGVDVSALSSVRDKAPNWTLHESARLCHVMNDPRNSTALVRLYNKPASRAELDMGRQDPWVHEFAALFNDKSFQPSVPEPYDGVTSDILGRFQPNRHDVIREGSILKSRWNKMRSHYSIAHGRYTKSGQGDADVFSEYTNGDPAIAYLHCVFYKSPSIDYVKRMLPEDDQIEYGISDHDNLRAGDSIRSRKRKAENSSDISGHLDAIAKSLSLPVQLMDSSKVPPPKASNSLFHEYEKSDRIADTVGKLMSLEANIITSIKEAEESDNHEYSVILKKRLSLLRVRIDKALE